MSEPEDIMRHPWSHVVNPKSSMVEVKLEAKGVVTTLRL
jgi:hypothetical protein